MSARIIKKGTHGKGVPAKLKAIALKRSTSTESKKPKEAKANNAQKKFAELLRAQLSPAFRAMGFKGSGLKYAIDDPNNWVKLTIIKSRGNEADDVQFWVKVVVISRKAWAAVLKKFPEQGPEPSASIDETDFGLTKKVAFTKSLGELMGKTNDQGFLIMTDFPASEIDAIATEIIDGVKNFALPAITKRLDGSSK